MQILTITFSMIQVTYTIILYALIIEKYHNSSNPLHVVELVKVVVDLFYTVYFAHMMLCKRKCFQAFLQIAQEKYSCDGGDSGRRVS